MRQGIAVIQASIPPETLSTENGLRPVNLRQDLAPLADLIELVFSKTMDANGRAAIREMRYLSRMGVGINLIGRLNDLALGISLGYVWIADGNLVGNVSIYPANWHSDFGAAWIIANVAVHPDYRKQGIARMLIEASLETIRQRGGTYAILQVDTDNHSAIRIYESLGFIRERAWTTWWRHRRSAPPEPERSDINITFPRRNEWRKEYELAQQLRPFEKGGMGWLRPLHTNMFKKSLWKQLTDIFSFNNQERVIVRSDNEEDVLASMWIERSLALSSIRLILMTPSDNEDKLARALLYYVMCRHPASALTIEHPADDAITNPVLTEYHFRPERTVWHMRWDNV